MLRLSLYGAKNVVVDQLDAERRLGIYTEKVVTQCRDAVGFAKDRNRMGACIW